tara:strand:- start:524 stop:7657 length:7134 start_codon:yes stop_codon:yes gene_type:complete
VTGKLTSNSLEFNIFDSTPTETPIKFSQWSNEFGTGITGEEDKIIGYSNYLREFELDQGSLDNKKEALIHKGALKAIAKINPEYELRSDVGTIDTDAALLYDAFGQEARDNFLDSINNGADRNDFTDEVNDAKRHLVEHDILPLASLKTTNSEGNSTYEVIGSSGILDSKKAINNAISKGALRHRDMWQVGIAMKPIHKGVNGFQAIRDNQIRSELAELSDSEEDKNLYDDIVSDSKKYFNNPSKDKDSSALITKARTLLARGFSRDKDIKEDVSRNRFQDADIINSLEQIASFESYQRGEIPFIENKDKLADNIKVTKNGAVIPHIGLVLDKSKFDSAIELKKDLSKAQVRSLKNYRKTFFTQQFPAYDDLFKDSTVENKWAKALMEGKQNNKSNGEILDEFLQNPKNYSSFKNKLGAIKDSIADSFTGLALVIPALFENQGAIDYLVAQEEDRMNRREVAKVFGKDFGFVMDVSTAIAPMVTDISATILLSSGTLGFGGAGYLAVKQGTKLTTKGLIKSLVASPLRRNARESTLTQAERLIKQGIIKGSPDVETVTEAISAYNKLLTKEVTKTVTKKVTTKEGAEELVKKEVKDVTRSNLVAGVQTSALFLTAANRSAGATYTTVYSNLEGTHAEKHDAAMGAALMAGMATGLITAGFSAVGAGGFDDAFLRGMTFRQKKTILENMRRSKIANEKTYGEQLKKIISQRIKEITPKTFSQTYQRFLRSGTEEFFEEAVDDFVNGFITDAALDQDTPMIEKISSAIYSGAIGGVIGQGAAGVRALADKKNLFASGGIENFRRAEENEIIKRLEDTGSPETARLVADRERRTALRLELRKPAGDTSMDFTSVFSPLDQEGDTKKTPDTTETTDTPTQQTDPRNFQTEQSEGSVAPESLDVIDDYLEKKISREDANKQFEEIRKKKEGTPTKVETKDDSLDADETILDETSQSQLQVLKSIEDLDSLTEIEAEQFDTLKEQLKDAAIVAQTFGVPMRIVPEELVNENTRAFEFKYSKVGNDVEATIQIDPKQLYSIVKGLNKNSAKGLIRAVISEEIIHAATYAEFTPQEISELFNDLSPEDVASIQRDYYINEVGDVEQSSIRLNDPEQAESEQRVIVREFLRMEVQKSLRGTTTESEIRFYKTNPSLFASLLRYMRNFIRKLTNLLKRDKDNARLHIATNRIVNTYNTMRYGYRLFDIPAFDPDNPLESVNVLRAHLEATETDQELPPDMATSVEVSQSQVSGEAETDTLLLKHGNLAGMLTLPLMTTGEYRGKYRKLKKWLNGLKGSQDPRLQRLHQQSIAIRNAAFKEMQRYKKLLDYYVAKEYPDGEVPVHLFRAITGDGTGLQLPTSVKKKIKRELGKKEKQIYAELNELKVGTQEHADKRKELDELDNLRDQAYELAFQAQKMELGRLRNEAIEQLGGFEADGVTPKKEIAKHLLALRKKTDEFSKAIRDSYPNSEGVADSLAATIDANLEVYITRSYKLFSEAGFAERMMESDADYYVERRSAAAEYFEKQYVNERARQIYLQRRYKFLRTDESENLSEGIIAKEAGIKGDTINGETVYEVFSMEDARKLAKAELNLDKEKGADLSNPIEAEMKAFLEQYVPKDVDASLLVKDKENAKPIKTVLTNNLKKRRKIPLVLRNFMGEEQDATGYDAIMKTYMHVAIMASKQSFLRNLVEFGSKQENKWFVTADEAKTLNDKLKDQKDSEGKRYTKITNNADPRFDPFVISGTRNSRYYVPEDLKTALQSILKGLSLDKATDDATIIAENIAKTAGWLTGLSMGAKTLGSVGFYIRNALSNMLYFAPSQGIIAPVGLTSGLIKEVWRKRGIYLDGVFQPEAINAYYLKLDVLNIIEDEIRPKLLEELFRGEITPNKMMDDMRKTVDDIVAHPEGGADFLDKVNGKVSELPKPIKKLYDKLRTLSAAMDSFYKIYYFEYELKSLKKAKEDSIKAGRNDKYAQMDEMQLEQEAADKVLRTSQSYSRSAPLIGGLSKPPYGTMFAPFVRFKGELVRIFVNTPLLAIEEMSDSNPVIKRRGMARMGGLTFTTVGLSALLPIMLRQVLDVEDDEDQALRRTLPSYLKNHTFFYFKGKDGDLYSVDMTYINPYSLLVDPFLRTIEQGLSGESPAKMGATLVKSMIFDEYLDEQIFAGALSSFLKNRNPQNNKKIWEERDSTELAFMKGAMFLFDEAVNPPMLKAAIEAAKISKVNSIEEALKRIGREFLPAKPHKIDLFRSMRRYLFDARRESQNISLRKNEVLKDSPMTDLEIKKLILNEVDHRVRIDKEVAHTLKNIQSLGGMTDKEVRDIVFGAQFGKRRYKYLMQGLTETPKETHVALRKKIKDKYNSTQDQEFLRRLNIIDQVYKSVPRFYSHEDI